jgi:hypothetical protein
MIDWSPRPTFVATPQAANLLADEQFRASDAPRCRAA